MDTLDIREQANEIETKILCQISMKQMNFILKRVRNKDTFSSFKKEK